MLRDRHILAVILAAFRSLVSVAFAIALLIIGRTEAGEIGDCRGAALIIEADLSIDASTCRRLAEQGDARAQLILGVMYDRGEGGAPQDYAEAATWYRRAAEQDEAEAQYMLGQLYSLGYGVRQDDAEAARWYREAAERGLADAQNAIGLMYKRGYGVQRSDAEAVPWFRRAAAQGDAEGQYNLGFMYEAGRGVGRDLVRAYLWFDLAGRSPESPAHQRYAIEYRDSVAARMTPDQLARAKQLAADWRPQPSP